ncbi:MAG TPA: tRNA (N6-isopentenyl adenosine(37)-C2)-methylthiotransferase MiaB [bacterium]|nr:tRNA (N6-isopentenyl adenosine(37)-C2)-methylthiotransferase MiaB [bacterium]
MKKYWIITYGCQRNKNDSERIASLLEKISYKPAISIKKADLLLINACSVRQSAIDRIWGQIKNFKKTKTKTILTGCVLKKDKRKFSKEFDIILDIKELSKLPEKLKTKSFKNYSDYLKIEPKYHSNFCAHVPIMTGCNNFCTYCAVPYTRGKEISRPTKEILEEIKKLIKKDYKEIWLLGENVNSFKSGITNFAKLLKMINKIQGKFWIRFMSPHPKDFSDELIKVMSESEKITPYLNLPIQSGDNQILKKMNRPYTIDNYKKLVKKIRKKIPRITLSTDVIVGFPGETKKQFENTAKLFKEIKFDMAYISQYSPRPESVAYKFEDNISHFEKEKREYILNEILKKTALENNKKYIEKIIEVLPREFKKGFLTGKSESYKTVKFEGDKKLIGNFVKVKIIKALPWGLKGKLK